MSIMTKIRECLINEIAKGILIANAVVNLREETAARWCGPSTVKAAAYVSAA